jgi:hypothetical protein
LALSLNIATGEEPFFAARMKASTRRTRVKAMFGQALSAHWWLQESVHISVKGAR